MNYRKLFGVWITVYILVTVTVVGYNLYVGIMTENYVNVGFSIMAMVLLIILIMWSKNRYQKKTDKKDDGT